MPGERDRLLRYDNGMYTSNGQDMPVVVDGHSDTASPTEKKGWKNGVCDCCQAGLCQTCCLGMICPCAVADAILRERTKTNRNLKSYFGDNVPWDFCCVNIGTGFSPVLALLQSSFASCGIFASTSFLSPLGSLLSCATICCLSGRIAEEENIQPNMCETCCCITFCPCLSLAQIYGHVREKPDAEVECCHLFTTCTAKP